MEMDGTSQNEYDWYNDNLLLATNIHGISGVVYSYAIARLPDILIFPELMPIRVGLWASKRQNFVKKLSFRGLAFVRDLHGFVFVTLFLFLFFCSDICVRNFQLFWILFWIVALPF